MKILMLSGDRSLAAGKRGAFYYMLEELAKYCERIDVLCPQNPKSKIQNPKEIQNSKFQKFFDNVYVHPGKKSKLKQIFYLAKRGKELWDEYKHDIVLIHEYPPFYNSLGARLLKKKIDAKFVVEIHHIIGYPRAAGLKEKFDFWWSKLMIPRDCKKFNAVRVVNKKQVPELLKSWGVEEDKLYYTSSMYIDLEVFKPRDIEKKYDLVFAGRLVRNKNLGMLIDVVKNLKSKVKSQIKSPKLVIVGDGHERELLESETREMGLSENVEFLGWLPEAEDLARVYNQSRIFAMSSLNEGGPRVCLEAMACGLPVVTTRVGVMLDIIRDGENGLFCDWTAEDMASKILEIYDPRMDTNGRRIDTNYESEPLKIKGLGDEARRTAERFERKEMIHNLAKTYQEIIIHE